ncbi:MAG: UDP-3-O-(3-hydroxymyristoyl)glucosamine N-acyltransferase [Phycisphaerales bacterium JB040]
MIEQRYTSQQLAELLNAELLGPPDLELTSLAPIDEGGPGSITFIRSAEYARRWKHSRCSAALVSRSLTNNTDHDPKTRALLVVDSADRAFVALLQRVRPELHAPDGVHPAAIVDPTATLPPGTRVGPGAVIGPQTTFGTGCTVGAGVVIGARCTIGNDTVIRPNAVIEDRSTIGDRCIIQPGVLIGGDGFGFVPRADGAGLEKVPHAGSVEIGNDVEIGSGSTIDRGKLSPTRIGDGTKIDNQVQIAHNCVIGRACLICAQTGIGGSTRIGDGVTIGGLVGIADNLTIGDGASIGAGSGLMHDVPAGEKWLGYPAAPSARALRQWAFMRKVGLEQSQRPAKDNQAREPQD